MTRRQKIMGQGFLGSLDGRYRGPLMIGGRAVGRVEYRRAYFIAFGRPEPLRPIASAASPRARKRALDRRRRWRGCEHEFEYREDTIGDYGVINGTYTERWLECACGERRSASWEDAPSDDWDSP